MILLNELFEDVALSNIPIVKTLFAKHGINILAIGLKKGVVLAEHTTPVKAKLVVLDGEIEFRISDKTIPLSSLDTYQIPIDVLHSVVATEDSIFMVIKNTK